MSEYLGGVTREELERRLRAIVSTGIEGAKIDFKRQFYGEERAACAELAKDVSSIANTDDEERYDDYGYIIFGVEEGEIVGCDLPVDEEKAQTRITQLLSAHLAPVPVVRFLTFVELTGERWGAAIIPPSRHQPHVFCRDAANERRRHEWWVRVNDTNELASASDYARFLRKGIAHTLAPLLERVSATERALASLPSAASGQMSVPPPSGQGQTLASTEDAIKATFGDGRRHAEYQLVADAERVRAEVLKLSQTTPWVLDGLNTDTAQVIVDQFLEVALPLARAMSWAFALDPSDATCTVVCRALSMMAAEVEAHSGADDSMSALRYIPLFICLYACSTVLLGNGRGEFLRRLWLVDFKSSTGRVRFPVVEVGLAVIRADPLFRAARPSNAVHPVFDSLHNLLRPHLRTLVAPLDFAHSVYLAEFCAGLVRIDHAAKVGRPVSPIVGSFMFDDAARRLIQDFLRAKPALLQTLVEQPIAKVLAVLAPSRIGQAGPSREPAHVRRQTA